MDEKPLKQVLNSIFLRLSNPENQKKSNLTDCWPKIAGSEFSKHTKPLFQKNGQVTVWVDDSTLAFELSQKYKPLLLKRLRNQFGEEEVKDLRFLVGEIH